MYKLKENIEMQSNQLLLSKLNVIKTKRLSKLGKFKKHEIFQF